jgi:hypothetical protein
LESGWSPIKEDGSCSRSFWGFWKDNLLIFKGENGAEGGTRTRMDFSTRPSNVRVYQFHHFGVR